MFRRRRQADQNEPVPEDSLGPRPSDDYEDGYDDDQAWSAGEAAGEDDDPGGQDAGGQYPGAEYPGAEYPGAEYPGAEYPGGRHAGEYAGERYGGDQAGGDRDDAAPADGPWDAAEQYPQRPRVDLGSLLIPVNPEQEVQLNVAGEQIVAASVTIGESVLQVQAFAAPKSGGLWDDVRGEIAEEISGVGGEWQEADGPFGPELLARVPIEPGNALSGLQPARYMGVDGPRWLLRGTISGQAVIRPELAGPLEAIFADTVVVRGDHPAPPRDLLEIQLPAEMREAIEAEMAQAAERSEYPNPFERGPEITETR